jgi:hypothetical protein
MDAGLHKSFPAIWADPIVSCSKNGTRYHRWGRWHQRSVLLTARKQRGCHYALRNARVGLRVRSTHAAAADKRTKRIFRKDGAFPYDERILSWDMESETVWLWRVAGRRRMPLEGGERERTRLERQPGESDLIRHRKAF